MADGDTWVCPYCKAVYVEDHQMWEDPGRCPRCGALLTGEQKDDVED